jgi:hypothetical protein
MKDLTWLLDYFTRDEVEEYRQSILKKYFETVSIKKEHITHNYSTAMVRELQREVRGQGKAPCKVQGRKVRGTAKTKGRKSKAKI